MTLSWVRRCAHPVRVVRVRRLQLIYLKLLYMCQTHCKQLHQVFRKISFISESNATPGPAGAVR